MSPLYIAIIISIATIIITITIIILQSGHNVLHQTKFEPRTERHSGTERGGQIDCGEEADAEGPLLFEGGGGVAGCRVFFVGGYGHFVVVVSILGLGCQSFAQDVSLILAVIDTVQLNE